MRQREDKEKRENKSGAGWSATDYRINYRLHISYKNLGFKLTSFNSPSEDPELSPFLLSPVLCFFLSIISSIMPIVIRVVTPEVSASDPAGDLSGGGRSLNGEWRAESPTKGEEATGLGTVVEAMLCVLFDITVSFSFCGTRKGNSPLQLEFDGL